MHAQAMLAADLDRPAQPVEGEPPLEAVGRIALAIDQHVLAIGPQDEVEQGLALRRQDGGPERASFLELLDVSGHQALEETTDIVAGESDQGAVDQGGRGHGQQLGMRSPEGKLPHGELRSHPPQRHRLDSGRT